MEIKRTVLEKLDKEDLINEVLALQIIRKHYEIRHGEVQRIDGKFVKKDESFINEKKEELEVIKSDLENSERSWRETVVNTSIISTELHNQTLL